MASGDYFMSTEPHLSPICRPRYFIPALAYSLFLEPSTVYRVHPSSSRARSQNVDQGS